MLKINFEAVHERYLRGGMEDDRYVFELVSPSNPKAAKHLSTHQIFSNNAIGVAVTLRNEVDEKGIATKVHAGLKLVFSQKKNGGYLLHNDPERITLNLDLAGVKQLYAFLKGWSASLTYDLVRFGVAPRQILGYVSDTEFLLTLRVSEFNPNGNPRSISVGLSDGDAFHLEMYCLALVKLLYPSFSDTTLSDAMRPRIATAVSLNLPRAETPAPSPCLPHVATRAAQPDAREDGLSSTSLNPQRCRTAVFAVGMQKWPRAHRPTIEFIQEGSVEVMDRLIKAGNLGDFSEWEKVFLRMNQGH